MFFNATVNQFLVVLVHLLYPLWRYIIDGDRMPELHTTVGRTIQLSDPMVSSGRISTGASLMINRDCMLPAGPSARKLGLQAGGSPIVKLAGGLG